MDIEKRINEQTQLIRNLFGEGDRKRDAGLKVPDRIEAFYDLPYDDNHLLDIYRPKEIKGTLPVIVNVHGGAYVYGSKEVYKYYGMFLAMQGFVFVNVNYTLAPEKKFPVQLGELCGAMQWVVQNCGKYGMDLKNVFVVGDSAGAQMASQLGAIYSNPEYAALFPFAFPPEIRIGAVALNCGMYDLLKIAREPFNEAVEFMDNYTIMETYLGAEGRKRENMLDVCGNITSEYPPAFVMTSYYDFLRENARPFYELLRQKGIPAEYHLYGKEGQEYMGHVFHCNMNLKEAEECNKDECDFFKKYLV